MGIFFYGGIMESLGEKQYIWEYLQTVKKPVVIYGMGDGCEKIVKVCNVHGIPVAGIFASDEYVRGHSFLGYPVLRYSEAKECFGEMVILLAFAAFEPGLVGKIKGIMEENELYAPDVPLFGGELFDRDYFKAHREELQAVFDRLADEKSKQVFRSVLAFKISGKPSYLFDCETPKDEAFSNILTLGKEECYADLGAYDGDTLSEFLNVVGGEFKTVYAFEPNPKNFKKLSKNFGETERIHLVEKGVWSCTTELRFNLKAGRSSAADESASGVAEVTAVDEWVKEPLSFLKFDVEGAEQEALKGAQRQICSNRPKIALSAYHRTEDLFSLPLQVLSYFPEYRLYLRHHPYLPAWDTLYYFVP